MNKSKTNTLIVILTAAMMLLIPIVAMAVDPPALVPKTGQTTTYGYIDDGAYQTGISSPNPRFTDNTDGTITDNLTGLVWLKKANCFEGKIWADALTDSNTLNSGECGLTDGSLEGDWRLPNIKELQSLIDFSNYSLALPTGYPFTNVQHGYNWTSTTFALDTNYAWAVDMSTGDMDEITKAGYYYVWPVRGPDRDEDGLDDHADNCPTVSNPIQYDADTDGIGDVCDPNTVYGTISGDVQEGVSIDISLSSCGETTLVATTTTNSQGYYAFGGFSNANYVIKPQNASYMFNPATKSVVIPQTEIQSYNFSARELPTLIIGTWTHMTYGDFSITFYDDGSFYNTYEGDGTAIISDNQITFTSDTYCGTDEGIYSYSINEFILSIGLISDSCYGRRVSITGNYEWE